MKFKIFVYLSFICFMCLFLNINKIDAATFIRNSNLPATQVYPNGQMVALFNQHAFHPQQQTNFSQQVNHPNFQNRHFHQQGFQGQSFEQRDHHHFFNNDYFYSYPVYTVYPYYYNDLYYTTSPEETYSPNEPETYTASGEPEVLKAEVWEDENGGSIPSSPVVFYDSNNNPYYECRGEYNNQIYYGSIVPNDDCYAHINNNSNVLRFDSYQVLTHE